MPVIRGGVNALDAPTLRAALLRDGHAAVARLSHAKKVYTKSFSINI
jgi:hypothetical protein